MPLRMPRRRTTVPAVAALALATAGVGLPAVAAVPEPGAPGIDDSYFPLDGNGGIDVLTYRIRNRYRFEKRVLSGRTVLRVRATQDLSAFNLDFLLPVTGVRVDGVEAAYSRSHNRHELTVTPAAPLTAGDRFRVRVAYRGRPDRLSYAGESNWLANRHEVVTMNQPHMAPWWFPANDHPRDKALMDISITVPRGHRVIANGHPVSRRRHGRLVTQRWRADEPMAPYLAMFAAGRFRVERGEQGGLPWLVAVSRELSDRAQRANLALMRRTPGVIEALEEDLGAYPFSAAGGLVTALPVYFALENQTRPTYPETGRGFTWLVVHEQAHQWFGDSVALHRWRDIWLNEGAATFMEVRYDETHGGPTGATWLRREYNDRPRNDPFWELPIGDPGPENMFDGAVYERGAMTFQALRNRIGEADFWTVLRRWVEDNRGGHGTREEFVALAEEVSGKQLDAFFTAWLDRAERPADTRANGLGMDVEITPAAD